MTYGSDNSVANFKARVQFAAARISSGHPGSRNFSSCFEYGDGDYVIAALVRRTDARTDTKLAKNIWRYLARDSAEPAARDLGSIADADLAAAAVAYRAASTATT